MATRRVGPGRSALGARVLCYIFLFLASWMFVVSSMSMFHYVKSSFAKEVVRFLLRRPAHGVNITAVIPIVIPMEETATFVSPIVDAIAHSVHRIKAQWSGVSESPCVDWELAKAWVEVLQHATAARNDDVISNWFEKHPRMRTWDIIQPFGKCPGITRVGAVGDGGKWVCLPFGKQSWSAFKQDCVVYSFGVSDDASFEEGFEHNTECEIHAFDPTPNLLSPFRGDSRVQFHRWGLQSFDGAYPMGSTRNVTGHTLRTVMRKLGHSHVSILKVDVENNEWRSFAVMRHSELAKVDSLLIELHNVESEFRTGRVIRLLATLFEHGLVPVYKEINNFCPSACTEVTFVSLRWLAENEPLCRPST